MDTQLVEQVKAMQLATLQTAEGETVVIGRTSRGIVATALDPATVALLVEIGKQLLLALAIKALSGLLGLDKGGDIKALLENLVKGILEAMKTVLAENEIRRATADLEGVYVLLTEYDRNPNGNLDSLSAAKTQSIFAVKQLESLLPLGVTAYHLGVLTRIAALQEQAKLSRNEGDVESLNQFAATGAKNLGLAVADLAAEVDGWVYGPEAPEYWSISDDVPSGRESGWKAKYAVRGEVRWANAKTKQACAAAAAQAVEQARATLARDFQRDVAIPVIHLSSQLQALSQWKLPDA